MHTHNNETSGKQRLLGLLPLLGNLASNRIEVTLTLRGDAAALRPRDLLDNLEGLKLRQGRAARDGAGWMVR